jgi:hypothetical protein
VKYYKIVFAALVRDPTLNLDWGLLSRNSENLLGDRTSNLAMAATMLLSKTEITFAARKSTENKNTVPHCIKHRGTWVLQSEFQKNAITIVFCG